MNTCKDSQKLQSCRGKYLRSEIGLTHKSIATNAIGPGLGYGCLVDVMFLLSNILT